MTGDFFDAAINTIKNSAKPEPFKPGELSFWDDNHISKSMLESHLNPDINAASRKHETINREIENFIASGTLKRGNKVLDLGCGPGLYANRLAEKGIKVTGVDISKRSLDYAVNEAKEKKLDVDYLLSDFLDINYSGGFDAALQVSGELNTLSDEKRDRFLSKIYRALNKEGLFIFDVTTRAQRMKSGLKNHWYVSYGGFWRAERHLVLEQGIDYPDYDVWLDQYIVIDDTGVSVYRNWFHDYALSSISETLEDNGFHIINKWNDLTGSRYEDGGDWIAVVAGKK